MAFIVFEGVDGAGKSSLVQRLTQHLESVKIAYDLTREPGGTELGEELRQVLLKKQLHPPVPRCEILLYEAIRAQHVEQRMKPLLQQGVWVICDRYTASTLAFQGGGRNLQVADVQWLNHFATAGLEPDLTVLLDLPVEESLKRIEERSKKTGTEKDRFESEQQSFHQSVRDTYLHLAKKTPQKWLVLNAMQTTEEMFQLLKTRVETFL